MAKKHTTGFGTLGRQALQGATFGFADEIIDVPTAMIVSQLTGVPFKELLNDARDSSRKDLSADWEERPVTSFTGQVAGSVPFGLTKAAKNAGNWIRGGSALKGIAKGAAVGAGYGGLAGVGAGDDTISDRLGGGASGAVFGGLLGGATAPLARVGTPSNNVDFRKVAKKTAKKTGNKAEKALAKKLAARPDLREQLTRAEAMDAASKRTGIDLTLAEKIAQSQSDPLLADQKILGGNPMTAGRMEQMYASRSGTPNQAGQIESVLQKQAQDMSGLGSYDEVAASLIDKSEKSAKEITKSLVEQAKPLYQEAYGKRVPPTNLTKLIGEQPIIGNAIKSALSDERYSAKLKGKPINSIEVLDAAKRIIDEKIRAGQSPMAPFDTKAYTAAQSQLLALADKYAPVYAKARGVYSGNPDKLNMRGQIGALADIDPMEAQKVAGQLFSGTQQNAQLAAKALGPDAPKAAAARIYNAMDTARGDPTSLAGKIAPDARTTDMLRAYTGGNQLDETLNVINQAKIGEKFRYGSPTQPLQEAQKGMEQAAGAGLDLVTGNKVGLLRKVAGMFGRSENDPQFYKDMGDLMLTDKGMDLLRRVSMGQQNAIQELQTVAPALTFGQKAIESAPVTRAIVGGGITPQQPQLSAPQNDFSDIENLLQPQSNPQEQPAQEDFSDIEELLEPTQSITEEKTETVLPPVTAPMRVPEDSFLDKVEKIESGGNPNAQAKTSSASGSFQFTDPTWKSMVDRYGAANNIKLEDKMNPDAQRVMAKLLSDENGAYLTKRGHKATPENLYLAHFLGAGGSNKVLSNPDRSAAELLPRAAKANQNMFYNNGRPRTGMELQQLMARKLLNAS
jgi:hypothetical protein